MPFLFLTLRSFDVLRMLFHPACSLSTNPKQWHVAHQNSPSPSGNDTIHLSCRLWKHEHWQANPLLLYCRRCHLPIPSNAHQLKRHHSNCRASGPQDQPCERTLLRLPLASLCSSMPRLAKFMALTPGGAILPVDGSEFLSTGPNL